MNQNQLVQYQDFPAFTSPIKVIIIDDHPVATDGLRSHMETQADIEVVRILHRGDEAVDIVDQLQPDVVVVDLELHGSRVDGVEIARQLRKRYSNKQLKLLVVSAHATPQKVLSAVGVGVDGYLLKTSATIEIIRAIYNVMGGVMVFDPAVQHIIQLFIGNNMDALAELKALYEDHADVSLTDREWEILSLIALGHSNSDIANHLVISEATVKTHSKNIFAKLGITSREQARVWYYVYRHQYED